ncbi:MAG: hypothetical protein QF473_01935, partial [Planctomycetota bacterium]|nr:hypothetical protein [Planctomycetota bacterium]
MSLNLVIGEGGELLQRVPRVQEVTFSNSDFKKGLSGWKFSEGVRPVTQLGRNGSPCVRLTRGGNLTRSIPVSRGEENMKGRRYLVTAWVKILRGRSASIQTGARAWRTPGSPGWQLMESVFDTEVRAPGSVDQPIPLSITADANSEVLVDDVRVAWIPAYGVHARFKVLQPEKGHFNGQAYVIRRHRDTAHRDVARHYFHSSVSSLAGEEGVPAGTFSDWFDVRRYLFGHGSSTVSIRVHPHHQDRTQPVKVILELSIGPVPVAKSSAGSGGQFELEEPDLDPED